ncbi:hypothetical protein M441DRAFT_248034 [Trichoderma asperellum CBS 433.97]|uniref:Uncharacterized protein n=1 Tax=Trichoderma asperellum (strain ATCC 204424 / CBS 433.97 / NBRC 101777) TaxID=1042311 RepID=A0A2T3Z031_TRIA4|nr:hypothetical protein M441DRAFT_248034 [Trichoderma asperellum CBS 433.97]PTB38179.1 hypothetical protein M441DRAFT_248034 [Trichoderma asperellum CBS 433.97]
MEARLLTMSWLADWEIFCSLLVDLAACLALVFGWARVACVDSSFLPVCFSADCAAPASNTAPRSRHSLDLALVLPCGWHQGVHCMGFWRAPCLPPCICGAALSTQVDSL